MSNNNYENLRSVKIAELRADGVGLVHTFTLPERMAVVNGKTVAVSEQGQVLGEVDIRGAPIGSCALCGYMPLYNHFTLKNLKTGEEINVGSECLADIMGEEKGERIKKAVESIKRKVSFDFRRPIKQADINAWLQKLATKNPTESRNKRIDKMLQQWPHYYYHVGFNSTFKESKNPEENIKMYNEEKEAKFESIWAKVPAEKNNDQKALVLQDAAYQEERDRTYWNYQISAFGNKDWNPQNMKSEYENQAKKDGIEIEKITWRELTPEERAEEHKLIDTAINEWIAKVTGDRK